MNTEKREIVQQLRDKTDAIIRRGNRLGRDVDVLNRLDDLMAKPTEHEDHPSS